MEENTNLFQLLFQWKCNKSAYRFIFLVFLIFQFLIGFTDWLPDIVFIIQLLLLIWIYLMSVKRYRDIWVDSPFLLSFVFFVPIIGFFIIYELLTKKSSIDKKHHLEPKIK